jgi:O-antigen/teichoic acid export membrane protein
MWVFSFSKAWKVDSMKSINAQPSQVDHLSGYLKALSSNYGLFVVNVSSYVITVPLLLKWLGRDRYGIWLIFLQLVYFASLVTTWIAAPIVREAATCYIEGDRQRTRRLFQTVSVYYALLGTAIIAFTVLGSQFISRLLKVPDEIYADAVIALMLLSAHIAGTIQLNLLLSLLNGFQHMHIANLLLGTFTPLGAGLAVGAVAAGCGLTGFAAAQLLAMGIIYAVGWSVTRRIAGIALGIASFDRTLLFKLIRSGVAYVEYSISYLMLQSDILLIGLLLGPSAAAVYGIGYKAMDYAVQLIWKIPDSVFPLIAALDASQGKKSLQQIHRLCGAVAMTAALLAGIFIALYGHASLILWVGIDSTAPPIVFIAFGVIIVLQVMVHSSLMISYATNRMSAIAKMSLIEGALKIVIAVFLLPRLGVIAVALATILAQVCITAWYIPLKACRITGDSLPAYTSQLFAPILPAAIAIAILGAVASLVVEETWNRLLISIPISTFSYFLIYISRGLRLEERRWMIAGMRRVLRI